MKLQLTNETKQQIDPTLFEQILTHLPQVIKPSKQTSHEEIELLLTDDVTIQEFNKRYRQKDKPTDVLSFNLDDPTALPPLEASTTQSKTLGQIVISIQTAQRQADQIGQSLEDELKFLFTHGLLHLHGYDHEDPEDEKIMLEAAYKILQRQ